jgi:hypothetical protein
MSREQRNRYSVLYLLHPCTQPLRICLAPQDGLVGVAHCPLSGQCVHPRSYVESGWLEVELWKVNSGPVIVGKAGLRAALDGSGLSLLLDLGREGLKGHAHAGSEREWVIAQGRWVTPEKGRP